MASDARVLWEIAEGLTAYPDALARMEASVRAIRAGEQSEQVWFVEHPPLYTAGSSARPEDLQQPDRFPTFPAGRGGQWTYHGPGQRVAYVMLDLDRPHGIVPARDLRAYVQGLEEWLIRTLDRFNIRGERRPGRVGIWIADKAAGTEAKIGAIGVRVTRWVTWHGISLNLEPQLDHFEGIVPCGIREYGVTSLHALGIIVSMAELDAALAASWMEVFGSPLKRG
nr:lipoyl(octanoyl) transferase LipB [Acidisoma cellulosilyticum]